MAYSGDLKTNHSKSRLFEDRISNSLVFKGLGYNYIYDPYHLQTIPLKIMIFLSRFAVICPDFECLGFWNSDPILKSRTFANQTLFEHSKSRLVQITDPHCILLETSIATG